MSLRKVGQFNDISPELLPKLPPKGTVVIYRSNKEIPNPIPDAQGRRVVNYPFQEAIPPTSSFWDSKKNNGQGEWVKIGLVGGVDRDGNPTNIKKHYAFWQQWAGHFQITIGSGSDVDALYQYLELASFVDHGDEDWQYDDNESIIMKRVDYNQEAQNKRDLRDKKFEAINYAKGLNGDDFTKACLVFGFWNANQSEKVLRGVLEDFAESNPADFMLRVNGKNADALAAINHALALGKVKSDGTQATWADSGGVLFQITGGDVQNSFVAAVEQGENGAALLASVVDANKKITPKNKK